MATFFVLGDSPYIDSCLDLSTMAMATKSHPQLPKLPLNNGHFFHGLMKKSRMVMKVDLYGTLMINCGNRILIVFHLYCCSKLNWSLILIANVANLARLAMLTFLFFCVFYFHILHMIGLHVSLGDTVSIKIAQ